MSIIFRQVEEIRSGRKTQTRRVCKATEEAMYIHTHGEPIDVMAGGVLIGEWPTSVKTNAILAVKNNGRVKWAVGREYAAVPKMYQPAFGRVRITAIRQERLHDITESDAIAEGVASVEEYRELWQSINGKTKGARWEDNPAAWVLTVEYVGDAV